ncbi:MAG TPA: hypothetical protein GX517_09040 [Alicyclobacillus sp.]|nr:hypothetical protein [Alicyclobacillus sp.]
MYADWLIQATRDVLGTTGVRAGTHSDPEHSELNARYSELYHRILGGLEDRGLCGLAADVQELAAVLGRIAEVSEKHAYAKGIVDGMWVSAKVGKDSPASRVG